MNRRMLAMGWLAALALSGPALAAESAPPEKEGYVSREEYEALRNDLEIVKRKLAEVEARQAAQPASSDMADQLSKIAAQAANVQPGASKILITGDAGLDFVARKGSDSTFNAGFSPLFLWQINDRLLFEGGIDVSVSNDPNGDNPATEVDLALANLSCIINDYLAAGGGFFTVPFGNFHTDFDPRWINQLPDAPLAMGDNGISPNADTGIFVTGAAPVGTAVVNYAAYVTNGPTLITDDPNAAGSLSFENFLDTNNNKAVGGRVGVLPRPELEVGYSVQGAQVNPSAFRQDVNALLQAVDANFVREVDRIHGRVTARGEWVWSSVSRATYDPTGALGFGPLTFDNDRNGGYALVSYRPTRVENPVLNKTEFVFRYDRLQASSLAPGGGTEERFTPGIDYWITASTVIKVAYEFDDNENGESHNAFLAQLATGF
jgi:hypothetical protein